MLAAVGCCVDEAQGTGLLGATLHVDATFKGPLVAGDSFWATSAPVRTTRTRAFFRETVLRAPRPGERGPTVVLDAAVSGLGG